MHVEQMRSELVKIRGHEWRQKVFKMSDKQILAVYLRFKSKGIIK